jgi:osmotically-inducible protein OsmY
MSEIKSSLNEERAMNISNKRLIIRAALASLAFGLGGIATLAAAQNAAEPAIGRSESTAVTSTQGANQADENLRNRVQTALHTDPYFYDAHVTVSVQNGSVVLNGFVFSDWDLGDALRIARKAAGNTPVVDNLSIEEGGRR